MIALYLLLWGIVGFSVAILLSHSSIDMVAKPIWVRFVAMLLTGPIVWWIAGYFTIYEWYLDRKYNKMFALLKLQKEAMDEYYKKNP